MDIIDIDQLKQQLQQFAQQRDWQQFHSPKNLAMALSVESAELVEIFQWLTETQSKQIKNNPSIKQSASHELADILLYLVLLAQQLDINLSQAIKEKFNINKQRYPVDLVKGKSNLVDLKDD